MHNLIQSLEALLDCHNQLLELARQKQDVLIKGDVQTLSTLTKEESRLVRKMGKLENERQACAQELASRHGLQDGEDITLDRLLDHLPAGEEKDRVLELARHLRDVIQSLKAQNELNMRLTQDALAMVDYSLELLTGRDEDVIYRKPTEQGHPSAQKAARGFFDAKA